MSAQDEIPTGRTWGYVSHLHARIEELEAALDKVTAERDEAIGKLRALANVGIEVKLEEADALLRKKT